MATVSAILELILLEFGDSASGGFPHWGDVAVNNFTQLEKAVGEVVSKAVTSADESLSDAEHNALLIKASGVLTGNRSILTQDRKGFWLVTNDCTGDFTLTFKTTSGTGVVIPQGGKALVVSDGTNILEIANVSANGTAARIKRVEKSGAYTAVPSDDGSLLACTATLTLSLKAAAVLGDKWSTLVFASTGTTTIDPSGAETINGAATLALTEGQAALVVCNGTAFNAVVLQTVATVQKTTPVSADRLGILDSAASFVGKWFSWGNILTALDALYQPLHAKLTAISGMTWAANMMPYYTGTTTVATTSLTAFARTLLDDSTAVIARGTLGVNDEYLMGVFAGPMNAYNATTRIGVYMPYAGSISALYHRLAVGGMTVALQINGVSVSSISAVSVTTTVGGVAATGANTFAAGAYINFVFSGHTSADEDFEFMIVIARS